MRRILRTQLHASYRAPRNASVARQRGNLGNNGLSKAKIAPLQNFQIVDLIWHEIQKISKNSQNEKTQHLKGCFKSIKQFQSNF